MQTASIEIDFNEYVEDEETPNPGLIELFLEGEVEPYIAANFSGHPDNWTPDEGGTACVHKVTYWDEKTKKELPLPEKWFDLLNKDELEEALYEAYEAQCAWDYYDSKVP